MILQAIKEFVKARCVTYYDEVIQAAKQVGISDTDLEPFLKLRS